MGFLTKLFGKKNDTPDKDTLPPEEEGLTPEEEAAAESFEAEQVIESEEIVQELSLIHI